MNSSNLSLREKVYCNWYLLKSDLSKDKELVYFLKSIRYFIILCLFTIIFKTLFTIIYLIKL